jgi:hypothetical protein
MALASIPLCFGASFESGIVGDITSAYALYSALAFSVASIFLEYFPMKPASSSEFPEAVSAATGSGTGVGTVKTLAGFGVYYWA